LLQAISKDKIIPLLRIFEKMSSPAFHGLIPGGEPHRALFITFILSEAVVLIGSLDAVAPILTM